MELMTTNMNTNLYIQSEFEFNQATKSGLWQKIRALFVGRSSGLRCFARVMRQMNPAQTVSLGLQEISLNSVTGSVDRTQDFSETFAPRQKGETGKERWRQIYMLAVSGKGFPPISLYKIGNDYFVKDGHHRVSVARYLGWQTLQAHVTELRTTTPADQSSINRWRCCTGEVVCAQL
jgi:hypothetical protein